MEEPAEKPQSFPTDASKTAPLLALSAGEALARELAPQLEHAAELIGAARADNTRRVYASTWGAFEPWCRGRGLDPWKSNGSIVATFLADLSMEGLAPQSLSRAYSAISFYLRQKDPKAWPERRRPLEVSELLRGAYRTRGRPPQRKRPLLAKHFLDLAYMNFGQDLRALRNRAVLLLGFHGGFRRSELVALDRGDVALVEGGLKVTLRRSKTDQKGEGLIKGIPRAWAPEFCTIEALQRWLKGARAAGTPIREGPLFRLVRHGFATDRRLSDRFVAELVKQAVKALGLDPDYYAGHSLRCGFVTSAALDGQDLDAIMAQTGHQSVEQVRGYIRRENVFQNNAADGLLDRAAKARAEQRASRGEASPRPSVAAQKDP
jgi:integrase